MESTWFEIGKDVVSESERAECLRAIKSLKWESTDKPLNWGFMQGHAIKSLVREFNIPNVKRIAWGGGLPARLEGAFLLAVDAQYSNGRTQVYFVDGGMDITPIYSERITA